MEQQNIERPKDLIFVSARQLPHGRVLYEMNSKTSAEWFNTAANKSNFLEFFGTNVVIKDRLYHIMMENVPVAFIPDNPAAVADIEKKAGLPPRTIAKIRYIKPIARRHPDQRTVHVAVTFTTKEGANQALKFGLAIVGKKVYSRKLLPELTRCLKCQSFDGNHVAAECPQEQNTCGTCGELHRTQTCEVTDSALHACANCKEKGHAAWSRDCPIFNRKWETFKRKNDEAKYIYYPTDDPLTWETIPDANTDWSNTPAPNLTDQFQPPQQNERHLPPQRNQQEWQTAGTHR
ncbi:hypothetical protein BDR06DRAFT_884870 [Suillus hirtellus]|nr:hypothetical protein BDR06DRAFT_884870 [Suillus hirtellus]